MTSRRIGGRPGDLMEGLPVSVTIHPGCRATNTSLIKVLRRPVESAQYTSEDFKKHCTAMDIVQSMGSVGDSYDNSMMESAWSSLKRELVYETHFATKEEARKAVFEWIIWYNNERLHSSIEYMSPMEFEASWDNQEAA
jgi:putative transposase